MGGLIVILPILALDVWLALTTGRRQIAKWREEKKWRALAGVAAAGLLLAVWFGFFIKYSMVAQLRIQGFPLPVAFFHLDEKVWTRTVPPAPIPALNAATNFITGLVAPLIPFKIAEFLKVVKAELK